MAPSGILPDGRLGLALSLLAPGRMTRRLEAPFRHAQRSWNGRRSALLLSFDCDFPEDCDALPDIAQKLADRGQRASFAVVGRWVEQFPEAHRAVVEAGHELVNHSYSHPELVNAPGRFVSRVTDLQPRRWAELSLQERDDEIGRCQQVVEDVLGVRMRGFRAPHFGNVDPWPLYPLLAARGLRYSTSMLSCRAERGGLPSLVEDVVEIPVTTCPRHPLSSLDTWHALYAKGGWHRDNFGSLLGEQLQRAVRCAGITNIYLDPKDVGRLDFGSVLDTAAALGEQLWMATYSEFADWFVSDR